VSTLPRQTGEFPLDPRSAKSGLRGIADDNTPKHGGAVTWNDLSCMWAAVMQTSATADRPGTGTPIARHAAVPCICPWA
jgi:hypothetical protein